MYTIEANSAVTGSELLCILSILEGLALFLILYWQFLFASEEFNLFAMAAPILPALIGEPHRWFARRQRLLQFLRWGNRAIHRYFLANSPSTDFLFLRDGVPRTGFLKTPARSDIPPPVWA